MAYGSLYGVKDVERCGLFGEMSYLHGKGYTAPVREIAVRDLKGPQLNPGIPKEKTGLQDCYFDTGFYKRIFDKEGEWTTPFQRNLRDRMKAKEKNLSPYPFVPSHYTKKQSCPGAFEGTFSGPVKAFSPLLKEDPNATGKKEKIPPNMLTNPAKKGGPGYIDICLSPYPKHAGGFYDDPFVGAKDPRRHKERILGFLGGGVPSYFDQNPWYTKDYKPTYKRIFDSAGKREASFMPSSYPKKFGDRFHGGFVEYPKSMDPRKREVEKKKTEKVAPFYPQIRNRSFYTKSVVNRKIDMSVNSNNWRTMQPVTFTKEYI